MNVAHIEKCIDQYKEFFWAKKKYGILFVGVGAYMFYLLWRRYVNALNYVLAFWLSKYKEKFVTAWTIKIMHFDNIMTDR